MKKIGKSSELLWILGTVFVALGVALCSQANLGVSMIAAPTFVIFEYIKPMWNGFSVGMVEYIIQGILLVILCLVVFKFNWRYLLAFAVAVIYGYTLNLFVFLTGFLNLSEVWTKWVTLIVGDIITAFGVSCYFHTYLPLQVYELFVAEISRKFKININLVKWCFDLTLLVVSILLAVFLFGDFNTFDFSTIAYSSFHSIGLGTLITTIINSPIISLMSKLIEKVFDVSPRFPKLESLLIRK